MDTALIVLVSLLVAGFALAFYMDWLGLWVSKEEMREQTDRAKERMQGLGMLVGRKGTQAGVIAKGEAPAEASGTGR